MAYKYLLDVYGPDGIPFRGPIATGEHQGKSVALSVEHGLDIALMLPQVNMPLEGILGGTLDHGAYQVLKCIDSMSPRLMQSLIRGHVLRRVVIQQFVPNDEIALPLYTTTLTNVRVLTIHYQTAGPTQLDIDDSPHLERVALAYETVSWHHLTGSEATCRVQ